MLNQNEIEMSIAQMGTIIIIDDPLLMDILGWALDRKGLMLGLIQPLCLNRKVLTANLAFFVLGLV